MRRGYKNLLILFLSASVALAVSGCQGENQTETATSSISSLGGGRLQVTPEPVIFKQVIKLGEEDEQELRLSNVSSSGDILITGLQLTESTDNGDDDVREFSPGKTWLSFNSGPKRIPANSSEVIKVKYTAKDKYPDNAVLRIFVTGDPNLPDGVYEVPLQSLSREPDIDTINPVDFPKVRKGFWACNDIKLTNVGYESLLVNRGVLSDKDNFFRSKLFEDKPSDGLCNDATPHQRPNTPSGDYEVVKRSLEGEPPPIKVKRDEDMWIRYFVEPKTEGRYEASLNLETNRGRGSSIYPIDLRVNTAPDCLKVAVVGKPGKDKTIDFETRKSTVRKKGIQVKFINTCAEDVTITGLKVKEPSKFTVSQKLSIEDINARRPCFEPLQKMLGIKGRRLNDKERTGDDGKFGKKGEEFTKEDKFFSLPAESKLTVPVTLKPNTESKAFSLESTGVEYKENSTSEAKYCEGDYEGTLVVTTTDPGEPQKEFPIKAATTDRLLPIAIALARKSNTPDKKALRQNLDVLGTKTSIVLSAGGSALNVPEGAPRTYIWSIDDGPEETLTDCKSVLTDANKGNGKKEVEFISSDANKCFAIPGRYSFKLNIKTNEGNSLDTPASRVYVNIYPKSELYIQLTWSSSYSSSGTTPDSGTTGGDMDLLVIKAPTSSTECNRELWGGENTIYHRNKSSKGCTGKPPSGLCLQLTYDDVNGTGPEAVSIDNVGTDNKFLVGANYFNSRGWGDVYAVLNIYYRDPSRDSTGNPALPELIYSTVGLPPRGYLTGGEGRGFWDILEIQKISQVAGRKSIKLITHNRFYKNIAYANKEKEKCIF